MTTLSELITDCRQRYNAVGDAFFSDEELYDLIYEAELEISMETDGIEKVYTTTTVVGQREYDYPTNALRLERVTYDGQRLQPIDFIEDDAITGRDENATSTGKPTAYAIFSDRLYLRTVPNDTKTLKIYASVVPEEYTSTTDSMTIDQRYRPFLKNFVIAQMFAKDNNTKMIGYYANNWLRNIANIKAIEVKRKVGDQYKVVKPDCLFEGDDFNGV